MVKTPAPAAARVQPVVLSGGSGTRLWPLSREKYPKQLLPLIGEDSLLQATVRRTDGIGADSVFAFLGGTEKAAFPENAILLLVYVVLIARAVPPIPGRIFRFALNAVAPCKGKCEKSQKKSDMKNIFFFAVHAETSEETIFL